MRTSLRIGAALLATFGTTSLASAQSILRYGSGTPGTGGKVPLLWVTSMARPGNRTFGLTVARGPSNGAAVPLLAAKEASLQVGGLTILIDLGTSVPLPAITLDGNGEGTLPLPLPNTTSLVGTMFWSQAFLPDSGASIGFSATQGVRVRVADFELLLGTRSTGSSSPQIAINLDTGAQSSFASANMTNIGIPGMYPRNGTHCIAGSGRTNKVALFDCRVFPPKFVREFGSNLTPWHTTWNPDGIRLYVVNQSSSSNQPAIDVYWGLPAASNFGTPYPGGSIPLGNIIDANRLEFTSDGNIGILATLGLFGGGGDMRKYDTKPSSSTYHKQLGNFKLSGRYIWDMCRIDDVHFAIAHAGFGGYSTIEIINIAVMRSVQTWGGQRFGTVIRGMVTDGSRRYLYVGNSPSGSTSIQGGIVRINVDRADPSYGQTVTFNSGIQSGWGVYDVELNDAGNRMYAIVGTGIQTSFIGAIHEYDTSNRRLLRTWSMNRLGNLYNLLIR